MFIGNKSSKVHIQFCCGVFLMEFVTTAVHVPDLDQKLRTNYDVIRMSVLINQYKIMNRKIVETKKIPKGHFIFSVQFNRLAFPKIPVHVSSLKLYFGLYS